MPVTGKIQIEGGLFQNAEGTALANGYLIVQLSHDEQESVDPGLVTGLPKIKIALDSNGNIPSSPAVNIWPNDQLNPSGSQYEVWGYASDGTFVFGPQYWNLTSAVSPYNVANQQPTNPPGTGGGGGGSSLILETNGTQNTNQALLNLTNGTNITITNSAGTTTINASGGPSSSYMLSAGIFDLATGYVSSSGGVTWTDSPNQVNFVKFVLLAGISGFTHMDASLGSNLGGGSTLAVGFYSSTGALLWSSGSQSIGNVNNISTSYTVPSLTLLPGVYYMAWTAQDSGNLTSWGWAGPANISFHNSTSEANVINQSVVHFGVAGNVSTSGPVLPAALGTLTGYAGAPVGSNAFGLPALFFH